MTADRDLAEALGRAMSEHPDNPKAIIAALAAAGILLTRSAPDPLMPYQQMRYYAAAPQPEALDEFPLNPKAVEFGRALGRIEAEREAMKVIGYLVTAAGGVIEVPDSLVVADEAEVLVSSDHVAGTTTYRARAALAREPATEGPPE